MNDEDYQDILRTTRAQLVDLGFSSIDERILAGMKGVKGAFQELILYLKYLRSEIYLGSDDNYRETLRRVREFVRTERGDPVEGIRIEFSPEEAEMFRTSHLDFKPSKELGTLAEELGSLINDLWEHRNSDNPEFGGES